jgi:glyoxylase-like metal-dependent hydrolase (beta-lactamase superfamily II)
MRHEMLQATVIEHPDGITAVDTDYIRPGLAAAHIIAQAGRAAFVDVGTNHSVPRLLAALERLGIARGAVDFVFLTHVHLDHAGGAGALIRELSNARAVIHPRGAPHLAEPARLIAASKAVYGESLYDRLYGELVPIPRERMILMHDGERIDFAGRELLLLATPGHALHHYSILDVAHANVFTGDTFGLSYRELDTAAGAFVVPTTTPTQFDPEQLIDSIRRILAYSPRAAYLMHYSRITGLERVGASLEAQIRQLASMARRYAKAADREGAIRAAMRTMWIELARGHGITRPEASVDAILDKDLDLNAQGLVAWLDRTAAQGAG